MYWVRRWWGGGDQPLPFEQFEEVVQEVLASEDLEHGSVSLTHESAWCLSYGRRRVLIFENLESDSDEDRLHMADVAPQHVCELWRALAQGDLNRVRREPWLTGYGD